MISVKLTRAVVLGAPNRVGAAGDVVELEDSVGLNLVQCGQAELMSEIEEAARDEAGGEAPGMKPAEKQRGRKATT